LLEQLPRHALPAGLPSDLMTRRPDILQAENNLRAANADIGAARAAFFPRLSLTASSGYSSQEMRSLFDSGSRVWSFAPQLTVPIFNAGRLRSELRLSEVRKSSAVIEYERVIQTAFREVSDGLAGRETYGRQIEAQQRVVDSAARRLELSSLRYRAGVEGRLELLDAQRQLYAARQSLLDLRSAEMSNAVALYKALGGGVPSAERRFAKYGSMNTPSPIDPHHEIPLPLNVLHEQDMAQTRILNGDGYGALFRYGKPTTSSSTLTCCQVWAENLFPLSAPVQRTPKTLESIL
jgi:outer membrane protein TolC